MEESVIPGWNRDDDWVSIIGISVHAGNTTGRFWHIDGFCEIGSSHYKYDMLVKLSYLYNAMPYNSDSHYKDNTIKRANPYNAMF